MKSKALALALLSMFLLIPAQSAIGASKARKEPRIRISAWYWLNSAPRSEWARDMNKMADLGFTHVALCWGFDSAAWRFRVDDTKYVLREAEKAGLGVYLVVWHPTHNTLPRNPAHQHVDVLGRLRFTFNTFDPEWRRTQWREYLQQVARLYSKEPAFAGYMFDDSFFPGNLEKFGGEYGPEEERYVSYSAGDKARYGKEPPKNTSDPDWPNWENKRGDWWQDWAEDTAKFIREVDRNPKHEIYVEDSTPAITGLSEDLSGIQLGKLARPLDAVGIYTTRGWKDGSPESTRTSVEYTLDILKKTRAAVGPDKKIIYTFWVANGLELRKPEPAVYPTFDQIRAICDAALKFGITHLDMYGYRIGNSSVTAETWPKMRPPEKGPYPMAGEFVRKHLYDRPELHDQLRTYLRGLNSETKR